MANKTYIMKTPEKILITIISFLLTFFAIYLLSAFTLMDFDASNWSIDNRAMFSFIGFPFSISVASIIGVLLTDN